MRKPVTRSIDQLRRDAKALRRAFEAGETVARQRIAAEAPRAPGVALKHADCLHVIARENGFSSWPALRLAADLHGLDRAQRQERLRIALVHGQVHVAERLLAETPDLARGRLDLEIALYERAAVEAALAADPGAAARPIGGQPPMCHLAFSRWFKARPEREGDMIAIAGALLAHGATANDGFPVAPGEDHRLSALYGAIGHADNMVLGRWLLEHGADPNDGESLYHATELGHHEGLRLLLGHGADPKGTNALLRAMDFDDVAAVRMLIEAGARADEFNDAPVAGERPWVVPALHQAARRMCGAGMVGCLLDAGAEPALAYEGLTPYAAARLYGNRALEEALEARGQGHPLDGPVALLAAAAEGDVPAGAAVDPAACPEAARGLLHTLLRLPGRLDHVRRLVALGLDPDRPDAEGLTPLQVAGWEGLPEAMGYLLTLRPDLTHVNGYGGTLLSTIIHGSENFPDRAARDHVECLRLALEQGVALPRQAIAFAGDPEVAEFLADWAEARPGQVVDGGPA